MNPDKIFLMFVRLMTPPMIIAIIATVLQTWTDSPTLSIFAKLFTTYIMIVVLVAIALGWYLTEESLGRKKE